MCHGMSEDATNAEARHTPHWGSPIRPTPIFEPYTNKTTKSDISHTLFAMGLEFKKN